MLGSYGQRYCTHTQMHTGHEIKKTRYRGKKKIQHGKRRKGIPRIAVKGDPRIQPYIRHRRPESRLAQVRKLQERLIWEDETACLVKLNTVIN